MTTAVKPGTYARAGVRIKWLTDAKIAKEEMKKVELTHPIFAEMAALTNDNLWKDIFTSASNGSFPKGFGYRDQVLFIKKKTKTFSVKIDTDPQTAYDTAKGFFTTHGGFSSLQDQSDSGGATETPTLDATDTANTESVVLHWSQLGSEKIQDVYLTDFMARIREKYNLSYSQVQQTWHLFNLLRVLGLLKDDNVIIAAHDIVEIKGLRYSERKKAMVFDDLEHKRFTFTPKKQSKAKPKNTQGAFITMWDKYISHLTTNAPVKGRPRIKIV